MATIACPYCYRHIDQRRLAYQCLGLGVPGGVRCTRSIDETRAELTNVRAASFPSFPAPRLLAGRPGRGGGGGGGKAPCPHCGGVTGVRVCPVCHSPLSSAFRSSRSPLIGMVGGKGAGKSVYLAVLNHELRTTVRRRFAADVWFTGDQQGGAGSPRQWLAGSEEQLFERGRLLEQTPSAMNGQRAPVVLEWRQPRRRLGRAGFSTTVLSFYDAAGEDLTTQEQAHTQAYLGVADGLVLLLDPWQLPGALHRIDVPPEVVREAEPPLEVLHRITELLRVAHGVRTAKRVPIPLAVVFAKMDAFFPVLGSDHPLLTRPPATAGYDESTGRSTSEQVRAMLHDYGADDIDQHLELNYADFRYFAVSALGAPPDYATAAVDAGGVQPFRVEEPLLWLLHRFGVIGRSRS
ncbi:MAG TPA: zinc ribbon domain-containing protein [Pseudonocardia sp.]|nr:zinc ribbon domain-containing protein [Pseudonocardia sp.]